MAAKAFCYQEAGERYGGSPTLLRAIALHESGEKQGVTHANSDGSVDYGVMQINSQHLPFLARYGVTEEVLLSNSCLNVKIGAWILSNFFKQYGSTWDVVGAYGAGVRQQNAATRRRFKGVLRDFPAAFRTG